MARGRDCPDRQQIARGAVQRRRSQRRCRGRGELDRLRGGIRLPQILECVGACEVNFAVGCGVGDEQIVITLAAAGERSDTRRRTRDLDRAAGRRQRKPCHGRQVPDGCGRGRCQLPYPGTHQDRARIAVRTVKLSHRNIVAIGVQRADREGQRPSRFHFKVAQELPGRRRCPCSYRHYLLDVDVVRVDRLRARSRREGYRVGRAGGPGDSGRDLQAPRDVERLWVPLAGEACKIQVHHIGRYRENVGTSRDAEAWLP